LDRSGAHGDRSRGIATVRDEHDGPTAVGAHGVILVRAAVWRGTARGRASCGPSHAVKHLFSLCHIAFAPVGRGDGAAVVGCDEWMPRRLRRRPSLAETGPALFRRAIRRGRARPPARRSPPATVVRLRCPFRLTDATVPALSWA